MAGLFMPRDWTRRGPLLLALGAALVAGSGWADDASWRAQWRKALALYKKKQYDAACPLFASVAAAQPKNGAVWGDLGLCELKRGELGESVHASRLAVRFGDERVRKSAYFNLGLASAKESLPAEGCALISAPSEAACSRPVAVCTKSWRTSGRVFQRYGTVAFFARTQAEANRSSDELPDLDPSPEAIQSGVALDEGSENSCGTWCQANAWQIDDSSLILKQATACEQKQRGPLPGPPDPCVSRGKRCGDILDCVQAVQSHIQDSPPIAREWERLHGKCQTDCAAGASWPPAPTCTVVHVDACSGHVGVVCSTPKASGGFVLRASEVELVEPESDAP